MVVILDDDEVFLRNDQIFPIDLAENIGLQHLGWWAGSIESRLEEDQSVHARSNHIDVVGDQEHGEPKFVVQVLDQLNDIMLSGNV